jgi:hypothetical protein
MYTQGILSDPRQNINYPMDQPSEKQKRQTVLIFDWDDTLMASSYISSQGYSLDNDVNRKPEVEEQLRNLEQQVCRILNLAKHHGDVLIITNAQHGWVQMSSEKYMPNVVPLLRSVTIISARSTYEHRFPGDPLRWKLAAFSDKLMPYFQTNHPKNMIAFGDMHVDRTAFLTNVKNKKNVIKKNIKFWESPNIFQLHRQLELVINTFNYIHDNPNDMDLMLSISFTNPTN